MGFDPPVRRNMMATMWGGDISGVTRGLSEGGPESVWVVRRYEFGRFAPNLISSENQT